MHVAILYPSTYLATVLAFLFLFPVVNNQSVELIDILVRLFTGICSLFGIVGSFGTRLLPLTLILFQFHRREVIPIGSAQIV